VSRSPRDYSDPLSRLFHGVSMGTIGLRVTLWLRANTIGEDERGNAERRALFVGLWSRHGIRDRTGPYYLDRR
jgi:hypothetical protein